MSRAVIQTISRLIDYMTGVEVDNKQTIDAWLTKDSASLELTIRLMQRLKDNGWDYESRIVEYMDEHSKSMSKTLYDRAIDFVKESKT